MTDRNRALEEAAKVADGLPGWKQPRDVAAAIRALITPATIGNGGALETESGEVADKDVMHLAHILQEWDMKEPPNDFTGRSYEDIARDALKRLKGKRNG